MMKEDGPDAVDLVDWVTENMKPGQTVGIDGMTFSVSAAQRMEQEFSDNGIKFDTDFPQFDYIYPDRPARPANRLFIHDENIVGETVESKISRIMTEVKGDLANAILLSALDDIAWATNLRTAGDITCSPIFVAFLYLDDERRVLFIDDAKLNPETRAHLQKYHIETLPYDGVKEFVAALPKERRLLIDPEKTARGIYDSIGCTTVFGGGNVARLKSVKNDTMLANLAIAMEKDGVALTRFFMEVERDYPSGSLTEVGLARRLRELRMADKSCVDESFTSIIGWNAHGAIVHYEPTEESDVAIACSSTPAASTSTAPPISRAQWPSAPPPPSSATTTPSCSRGTSPSPELSSPKAPPAISSTCSHASSSGRRARHTTTARATA